MKNYELRILNCGIRTIVLSSLAVMLLAAGCSKKTETANMTDSTATTQAESTATSSVTPPPPPPPPALSDANIIAMLSEADSTEITEAKVVLAKTKNADVRSFANMMVTDHSRMKKEKADLATKLNITPQPPANDNEPAALTAELSALGAAATPYDMDSIYISDAVMDHEKDSSDLIDLETKATAPELKDAITKAQPVVNKHLDHAEAVQAKLSKMSNMAMVAKPMHGKAKMP
jgi:putative membrane protein